MFKVRKGTILVWFEDYSPNPTFGQVIKHNSEGLPVVASLPVIIDEVESYPEYVIAEIFPFIGAGYMERLIKCTWCTSHQNYLYKNNPVQIYDENKSYRYIFTNL